MTYKKLLSQLNDLKNIRPPKNWLESNREILLSQISNSGATELSYWQKFKLDLKSYGLVLSRPAMVMASLFILFFEFIRHINKSPASLFFLFFLAFIWRYYLL